MAHEQIQQTNVQRVMVIYYFGCLALLFAARAWNI
jgi:hypothetical protein